MNNKEKFKVTHPPVVKLEGWIIKQEKDACKTIWQVDNFRHKGVNIKSIGQKRK